MQIIEPALGRYLATQVIRHPSGNLPPAPNAAIGGIFLQSRVQGRQARIVQHPLGPFVLPPPVAQTGQALGIPAINQPLDPALTKPRHPRRLRH